jgi:hypothetical protein
MLEEFFFGKADMPAEAVGGWQKKLKNSELVTTVEREKIWKT